MKFENGDEYDVNNCGWCFGGNFSYDDCICDYPCSMTNGQDSRLCRGYSEVNKIIFTDYCLISNEYCKPRTDHEGEYETHCSCWWDGDYCCACGASGMTDEEKREQGMEE